MSVTIAPQGITARLIDVACGAPAAGVPVRLELHAGGKWHPCGIAITGVGGRAQLLGEEDEDELEKGDYRLTFEIAAYFKAREIKTSFPFVQVTFSVAQIKHHHVALLLGPFGYAVSVESEGERM